MHDAYTVTWRDHLTTAVYVRSFRRWCDAMTFACQLADGTWDE
jgi:hypothetical protein